MPILIDNPCTSVDPRGIEKGIAVRQADCIEFALLGGHAQQPCFVEHPLNGTPDVLSAEFSLQFPVGWDWTAAPLPDDPPENKSTEHKLICLFTASGAGRMLLNLRGGGTSPEIAVHFERLGGAISQRFSQWPPDGLWHTLRFSIYRAGRFRCWLDGRQIADIEGATSAGSPYIAIQFGAFLNQRLPTYPASRVFRMRGLRVAADVDLATVPPVAQPLPPDRPPTPPADTIERIAVDVEDLMHRAEDLMADLAVVARRVRALGGR